MDKWTEEDERNLQALQQRRQETHERQAGELMLVIERRVPIKSGSVSDVSVYDLRKAMIAHGGEFRDALEPFDHMGRPECRGEESTGWIEHDGGDGIPLRARASDLVEIELRSGERRRADPASVQWANHVLDDHPNFKHPGDVMRYRVIYA